MRCSLTGVKKAPLGGAGGDRLFSPSRDGGLAQGHPVGCAAGLAMVELMEGGLLARGVALGDYMGSTLEVTNKSPPFRPSRHPHEPE